MLEVLRFVCSQLLSVFEEYREVLLFKVFQAKMEEIYACNTIVFSRHDVVGNAVNGEMRKNFGEGKYS